MVTGNFSELYLGHKGSSCVGERKHQEPDSVAGKGVGKTDTNHIGVKQCSTTK